MSPMSNGKKNAQGVSPSTALSRLRGCPICVSFAVARKLGSRVKRETRMEVACRENVLARAQEISREVAVCVILELQALSKQHLEIFLRTLRIDYSNINRSRVFQITIAVQQAIGCRRWCRGWARGGCHEHSFASDGGRDETMSSGQSQTCPTSHASVSSR